MACNLIEGPKRRLGPFQGRVPGTRELVLHKNYLAIYHVRGGDVEILRLHHVARNL